MASVCVAVFVFFQIIGIVLGREVSNNYFLLLSLFCLVSFIFIYIVFVFVGYYASKLDDNKRDR
jgi:hypothetical protein